MNLSTLAGNEKIKGQLSLQERRRGLSHAYIRPDIGVRPQGAHLVHRNGLTFLQSGHNRKVRMNPLRHLQAGGTLSARPLSLGGAQHRRKKNWPIWRK